MVMTFLEVMHSETLGVTCIQFNCLFETEEKRTLHSHVKNDPDEGTLQDRIKFSW